MRRRVPIISAFLLLFVLAQGSPNKPGNLPAKESPYQRVAAQVPFSHAPDVSEARAVAPVSLAASVAPTATSARPRLVSPRVPAVPTAAFGSTPAHAQRGITVILYTDAAFGSKTAAFLDHLAGLGVNSINAVIVFVQSTYTSSDPHLYSGDATPSQMQEFIIAAHHRGMSVMIRPLMDDSNLAPQWRGTVLPADPASWFSNYYNNVLAPYISLNGVDIIDIGSEMATLADRIPSRWLSLISTLRSALPAVRLTYSSTDWIALPGEQQPYPTFAESLDLVGVDAFFPLQGVTNGYDVSQLTNAWQPSLGKVLRLATYYHKPVLFTELGLASQCCTLTQPFVFNAQAAPNLQAQAVYYAAACRAVRPYHYGLYWWVYSGLDPLPSPATDNAFSPYGKPAEQEMARCYQSGY